MLKYLADMYRKLPETGPLTPKATESFETSALEPWLLYEGALLPAETAYIRNSLQEMLSVTQIFWQRAQLSLPIPIEWPEVQTLVTFEAQFVTQLYQRAGQNLPPPTRMSELPLELAQLPAWIELARIIEQPFTLISGQLLKNTHLLHSFFDELVRIHHQLRITSTKRERVLTETQLKNFPFLEGELKHIALHLDRLSTLLKEIQSPLEQLQLEHLQDEQRQVLDHHVRNKLQAQLNHEAETLMDTVVDFGHLARKFLTKEKEEQLDHIQYQLYQQDQLLGLCLELQTDLTKMMTPTIFLRDSLFWNQRATFFCLSLLAWT